jgi:hypothetical protein
MFTTIYGYAARICDTRIMIRDVKVRVATINALAPILTRELDWKAAGDWEDWGLLKTAGIRPTAYWGELVSAKTPVTSEEALFG